MRIISQVYNKKRKKAVSYMLIVILEKL